MINAELAITRYVALRDAMREKTAATKQVCSKYEAAMARIETALLSHMRETGARSLATSAGTAFQVTKRFVNVADKDALLTWLRETDAWDMLTVQANKPAVAAYREQHDELPPGIRWQEQVTIRVLR
jgi:hypothetical protein